MIRKSFTAAAAIIVLALLASPALAAPMKCSGEQKTCNTVCLKTVNPALQAQCIADCHARLNYCKQTGCWNNGTSRYCGLMRQ
jgi:hypothetical protein